MGSLETLNCRSALFEWKCRNTAVLLIPRSSKPTIIFHSVPPSRHCLHFSPPAPLESSAKHTTLPVEAYRRHRSLTSLIQRVRTKGSNALQVLVDDGDWSKEQFWAVVRLLLQESRSAEVLPVFDRWMSTEDSRINVWNYCKMTRLLCAEGLVEQAVMLLQEMKDRGLSPSLEIYNSIIHAFAGKARFDKASFFLNGIREAGFRPDSETYDGLIESYGRHKMYDEMGMCVRRMESEGCTLDHLTLNLLIREFSRGGLLTRMENTYRSLLSRRMPLQPSTLAAVLEAYASFRILDKMENAHGKARSLGIQLSEALIRKLAEVYIQNNMFSRLDDLGRDLFSTSSDTKLAGCLCLLSQACLASKKGMDLVVSEMREAGVPWCITCTNTILLAYMKMKDLKGLKALLRGLRVQRAIPDIVTLGILFDAEGSAAENAWRRMGLADEIVEMNTDPLVLSALGKGRFLRNCEEMYRSMESKDEGNKVWTYRVLIEMVNSRNRASTKYRSKADLCGL